MSKEKRKKRRKEEFNIDSDVLAWLGQGNQKIYPEYMRVVKGLPYPQMQNPM